MSYGLLWSEAKLARRVVKPPEEGAPLADGTYGSGDGHPLRLTLVGDSTAAGMGALEPAGTPGALLATELAAAVRAPRAARRGRGGRGAQRRPGAPGETAACCVDPTSRWS